MKKKAFLILAALAVFALSGVLGAWIVFQQQNRTPGELLRYVERRLQGHNKLEAVALPITHRLRLLFEHPVPPHLPTLGKGAQESVFAAQSYDASGKPQATLQRVPATAGPQANFLVHTESELRDAFSRVQAGQIIELAPGTQFRSNKLKTLSAGTAAQPIIVRAAIPGSATIEFFSTVGFDVDRPYWIFENLVLRGVCGQDSDCEHAFHIFGAARNTVIRNNRLENFNAQLKINGSGSAWPDAGLVQGNTLSNARVRRTHLPVTPIDIVGANDWVLADNLVSNFIKEDGNLVSFGIFVKGASRGAIIERNLVICTRSDISQPGVRVGISVGGGGTDKPYCRDKRCDTEHTGALVRNNIVAHCNDSGIDVNRSNQTLIVHNTLINTAGISLRHAMASARIEANRYDGSVKARDGSLIDASDNAGLSGMKDADTLDLHWQGAPPLTRSRADNDFCGKPRGERSPPGALVDFGACGKALP